MKYRLTVLTPTLIGDGTRLSPIDYMVWRDQVNVLNQPRIFKLLSKGPRLEGYLTQLRRATTLDFASWGGFAQNFADRRIPFEDPAYTAEWNKAKGESLTIPTFTSNEMGPVFPGSAIKGALRTGRGLSVSDSGPVSRETFRVYMLRVSTLIRKGPDQYSLGWKEGKTTFAEMADPGTTFTGEWKENRSVFDSANRNAAKQLEIHAQYAKWSGLEALGAAVANLQQRLDSGRCLLCIGWGGGILSKSTAIFGDEAEFHKKLSVIPSYERAIKSGMPFPKTRQVVFLKNKPATLPGWVELRVD